MYKLHINKAVKIQWFKIVIWMVLQKIRSLKQIKL